MKATERVLKTINALTPDKVVASFLPRKNAIGDNLANDFLKHGNRKVLDTDLLAMADADLLKGYMYGAIKKRANRISTLGVESVKARDSVTMEEVPREQTHPYLKLIDSSPTFTTNKFFKAFSYFTDLKGVSYILAVRNYDASRAQPYGEVQEFQILNPYKVRRVLNSAGEVGGYVEHKGNTAREIPKEMVIVTYAFNPFDMEDGLSMSDAAMESNYLLRTASTFTRRAIKNNVGQRGLLSTDIIMDDKEFENFKARVETSAGEGVGKFLYGNGPGALSYVDMQIDLDKLALDKVRDTAQEELFAVSGMSKTMFGIEQSGVTRDSSATIKELFTENEAIPSLQDLVDSLNQDYRNSYKAEYENNPIELFIDSPLKQDADRDLKQAQVVKTKTEAAALLVRAGFDPAEVLKLLELEEIAYVGPPANLPSSRGDSLDDEDNDKEDPDVTTESLDTKLQAVIDSHQSTFETNVVQIDGRVLEAAIRKLKRVKQNALEEDVLYKTDAEKLERDLMLVTAALALTIIPLFATQTTKARLKQYGKTTDFTMTPAVTRTVKAHAGLVAASHLKTVSGDIYKYARELSLQGKTLPEIESALRAKFTDRVSRQRAKTLSKTETLYGVRESQYQADLQFLKQNDMLGKAYKRWVTRSGKPCELCKKMEGTEVPFEENFLELGDTVTADVVGKDATSRKTMVVDFEPVGTAALHPNDECTYDLVIK